MQYALLIYEAPDSNDGLSDEERNAISGEYLAIRDDRRVVGGAHLGPVDATSTVRVAGGGELAARRHTR